MRKRLKKKLAKKYMAKKFHISVVDIKYFYETLKDSGLKAAAAGMEFRKAIESLNKMATPEHPEQRDIKIGIGI